MVYCRYCGSEMEETALSCPKCGNEVIGIHAAPSAGPEPAAAPAAAPEPALVSAAPTTAPGPAPVPGSAPAPAPAAVPAARPKSSIDIGLLIWSILNMVICCMPLGTIGLVFTVLAQSKPTEQEEKSALKTAKIVNLIGTLIGVIILTAYLLFMFGMLFLSDFSFVSSQPAF